MGGNATAFPLRALSVGEIFDRAVTIYVRYAAIFTAIVLTLFAPISLMNYFAVPHDNDVSSTINVILHPGTRPPTTGMPPNLGAFLLVITVAFLLAPFATNAVAVSVAAVYKGRQPEYGPSFLLVVRRWLPLLGTLLLEVMIFSSVYFSGVFALIIPMTIGVILARTAFPVALVLFVLSFIGLLALVLCFIVLVITYAFATYATTLETLSPAAAIASSFRRIINRREIGKAVLMGLAYVGLNVGVLLISFTVSALVLSFVKVAAVEFVISTILNSVFSGFLTVLLAVYYFDVRTRTEGLDLEMALERLTATA
jgi:hypothetical protein